jgi:hypothetical protein
VTVGRDERLTVETSIGPVSVVYGWSGWVTASVPRGFGHEAREACVARRPRELTALLVALGVSETEAKQATSPLWRARPRGAGTGEADPWEPFWKRSPNGTLVVGVLFLAGILVMIIGFGVQFI